MIIQSAKILHADNPTYKIKGLSSNLHLISVETDISNSKDLPYIDFILPAWRPGRYQIQNYAANIQEFSAKNNLAGTTLTFKKIDKQTWRVNSKNARRVRISYKYFAGAPIDAGNCYFGANELYFNGSNLFLFTKETRNSPCLLEINVPRNWKIATQLKKTQRKHVFFAKNYDELVDSPTLASKNLVSYKIKPRGVLIHIHFANKDGLDGNFFNKKSIKRDLAKIAKEQFKLMGVIPIKEYHFIYHILNRKFWHGVEHKNSTSIVLGPADQIDSKGNYNRFLSISSHEFFHLWNVKRLIPKEFVPYDYTKEMYSRLLYISEGFTSYFGDLTLARSKLLSLKKYLKRLSKLYTNIKNSEGYKIQSLALSSFDAWLSGYGMGRHHSTVSFYGKGELVALMLDLEIRELTNNKASLATVMQNLFKKFPESKGGFSEKNFEKELETVSGKNMKKFLNHYVYGTNDIDLSNYATVIGLKVKDTTSCYLGVSLEHKHEFPVVSSVVPNSPAEKAMLYDGDMLIAIDNISLRSVSISDHLSKCIPLQKVNVSLIRNNKLETLPLVLGKRIMYSLEIAQKNTAVQKKARVSWVGSHE